ncbi:MAG: hypothetical protein WA854_09765, partial [Candidatus Binataceae bacterium]
FREARSVELGAQSQTHREQSRCCSALVKLNAACGEPNEFAAPSDCAVAGSELIELEDPVLDATPGEPKNFAAPAFCSAPGSDPKPLAAPIPPAVPKGGGLPSP